MAGIVTKEFFRMKNENEGEANENNSLVADPSESIVSEHGRDELVCSVSPSGTTPNEILLYVDNQNEGVHDLIRVALNQSMSTEELQQQLQEAGTNITLQNLGVGHTIVSMDKGRTGGATEDDKSALMSDGTLPVVRRVASDGTTSTNIFQLASLTDSLSTDREQSQYIGTDLDIGGIKSESLEDETDGTTIEDYIIANVNSRQSENTPGELEVGNVFYSLEEVEDALRLYEEGHCVKLYKRDVRSLEALMKRSLKLQKLDKINESLKYGQLLYCCVYGGKRRAQKLACVDECGVARYTDCKMFIRFAISDDGMKLVVNGKLETHNHDEVVADEQYTEPVCISNTGNADDIRLGAGFVDLEELYKAIHKYETDNHVHLWRRDGRTVEALAKRAPGTARKIMETNPGLRFAELRFCCSYGGRQIAEEKKEKMRATKLKQVEYYAMSPALETCEVFNNEVDKAFYEMNVYQSTQTPMKMDSISSVNNNCDSNVDVLNADTLNINASYIDVDPNVAVDAPNADLNIEIVTQMYTCGLDGLPIQLRSSDVISNNANSVLINDIENFQHILIDDDTTDIQVNQLNMDYLVFECFKDFEEAFRNFQKDTLTSFCTAHNTKDFAKFLTLEEILNESKEDCSSGLPYIRWEFQTGGLPVPYLGYPFISVGHAKYDCSQGKDRNLSRKEKYRLQKEEAKDQGVHTQTRILSRPTKKMGCPVSMCCKKIYAFPNFAIAKDTKRNRSVASLKLRKLFEGILSNRLNGDIKLENGEHVLGTLLYITKFPDPVEHKYHLEFTTDKNSALDISYTNQLSLYAGAAFPSLKDAEEALTTFRSDRNLRLYCSVKECIRNEDPVLKYDRLTYRCLCAVNDTKRGKNLKTSSFKQGCEMHIRFGVSDDGSQLVVKSMSEEHNHEINEETIVKEALHPELCSYVSKLVWSDINIGIDEVKRRLEHYVFDEMFKDQTPPPRTRRQYFPSKKQIRYFMAKAKASLNISQEAEIKLEAQAEKLKESRGDEKMIFNFKVSHDDLIPSELTINNEESVGETEDSFFTSSNPRHDNRPRDPQLVNEVNNAKILFCHQTPHQQRLMRRYCSQFILTQISDIHSKIPFPLFCIYVQTNVDFQLVGEFILQANTAGMLMEGLQTFKEWNPGWSPKFVIVDFSEEQISAVESIFPGSFVLISDVSREKAWSDWLSLEENEVSEHKDEITSYLQAIANSHSEDTLNGAARELEESDIWKISDKLRNWFQMNWLAQAKRWVAGYRPDDYLLLRHHGRTLEMELRAFKSIKLVNKSAPLQDVIQQIVEHVAPVSRKQYELLNQESVKLQSHLRYLYSDLPNYLVCRPGKLTYHVYERVKLACEQSYTLSYLHPGIFSVQCCSGEDDVLHTVSFGDSNSFPSCDCPDWQLYKLPCVHLCAVFNSYPGWTWDMLSVSYKSSPVLNVDWSFAPEKTDDYPGNIIDKCTQTSDATLISNSPQFSKMTDSRRLSETPQVLASQCRGLLQQLSKLQLAQHSRDNLYRLKSELKELISLFSNSTKQKIFSPVSIGDSYSLPNKGPGRPRKIVSNELQTDGVQSVFEQYNVTPVTPRQVNDCRERKVYPSRNRTSSSQLVISKPPGEPSGSQDSENNILGTVYIVDPTRVLVSTHDNKNSQTIAHNQMQTVTNDQLQSVLKLKSNPPIVRKRIQSPSVFLKPPDKRIKGIEHDPNFDSEVPLEFSQENVDMGSGTMHENSLHDEGIHDDTLLTVDEDSSISAVIDDRTIDIQLEQVSVSLGGTTEVPVSMGISEQVPVSMGIGEQVPVSLGNREQVHVSLDDSGQVSVSMGIGEQVPVSMGNNEHVSVSLIDSIIDKSNIVITSSTHTMNLEPESIQTTIDMENAVAVTLNIPSSTVETVSADNCAADTSEPLQDTNPSSGSSSCPSPIELTNTIVLKENCENDSPESPDQGVT